MNFFIFILIASSSWVYAQDEISFIPKEMPLKNAPKDSTTRLKFSKEWSNGFGKEGKAFFQSGGQKTSSEIQGNIPFCTLTSFSPFSSQMEKAVFLKDQEFILTEAELEPPKTILGIKIGQSVFVMSFVGSIQDGSKAKMRQEDLERAELFPNSLTFNIECPNFAGDPPTFEDLITIMGNLVRPIKRDIPYDIYESVEKSLTYKLRYGENQNTPKTAINDDQQKKNTENGQPRSKKRQNSTQPQ